MGDKGGGEKGKSGMDKSAEELGANLLMETSDKCDMAVCKDLIDRGADVNARDEEGCTPLLWAALSGKIEVVDLLLQKGADASSSNNDGETPLHWAAISGNRKIAELLIQNGADVNAGDIFGITPIRSAELNEDHDMVQLMKKPAKEK